MVVDKVPLITKPGVYRRIDSILVKVCKHDDLDLWVGDDGFHRYPDGRFISHAGPNWDLVEYVGPLPEEPAAEVQATIDQSDTKTWHEAEPHPGGIMSQGVDRNPSGGNFTTEYNFTPEYTESIASLRDDRDRLKSALAESTAAIEGLDRKSTRLNSSHT